MDYTKLTELDWDYLIILDACRYDYFEANYHDFFDDGVLCKGWSVGSSTGEWRDKTFKYNYPDVIYITANPVITMNYMGRFCADERFHSVRALFVDYTDPEYQVVMPDIVRKHTQCIAEDYPDKRLIIHLMQPHDPYIGIRLLKSDFREKCLINSILKGIPRILATLWDKVGFFHPRRIPKIPKSKYLWRIRWKLGLPPMSYLDAMRRKGPDFVGQAYNENVRTALQEVSNLVKVLDGKIIITADHGECLGEDNLWFHFAGSNLPQLREVPIFTVDKRNGKEPKGYCQELIQSRLEALGYA